MANKFNLKYDNVSREETSPVHYGTMSAGLTSGVENPTFNNIYGAFKGGMAKSTPEAAQAVKDGKETPGGGGQDKDLSADVSEIEKVEEPVKVEGKGATGIDGLMNMGGASSALMGGAGGAAGAMGAFSDRRLKHDIEFLRYSPSGLKIYKFKYNNIKFGKGTFEGVMSDEIPQEAVIKYKDGYDRVDYSKLDVEFKQI
jgi:hypothetical protein